MSEPPGSQRHPHGRLAATSLLLAYAVLAIAYQRAVPLFEAPDEPSHIHYVVFLSREGRLPRTYDVRGVPGEGMQPPLYYELLAPLFALLDRNDPELLDALHQANLWIYNLATDWRSPPADARIRLLGVKGASRFLVVDPSLAYLRALRWGSLPFGVLAVLCSFAAARRVSESLPFAVLCTALLAFSPQFLFVSAYVSNDVACAALGAASFWLFARALAGGRVGRGHYAAAALLVALGLATKHSSLPAVGVCFLALFALDARPLRARAIDAGLAALLALVLALPTLFSNLQRFGDPLGVSAVLASAQPLSADFSGGHSKYGGLVSYLLNVYPYTTFGTYWAVFGWQNLFASRWLYIGFVILCGLAALGFARGWRAERRALAALPSEDTLERRALLRARSLRRYLVATILTTLAAHLWINLHAIAPQGRHLFGAAAQIAALLALGVSSLGGGRAFAPRWGTAGGIAAGMAAAAVYCLTRLILPAYR